MRYVVILAAGLALAGPAMAEEFEKCSIMPVDQVGYVDTFLTADECVAACREAEGCDSWEFRPHSFDSSMPGGCKLIKGVYKMDDSERAYCGKL